MPRLRKKWDEERSPKVYAQKVQKIWRGVGATAFGAEDLSRIHANRLVAGSKPWVKARAIVKSVLAEHGVEKLKYVPYIGAVQFYLKCVTDRDMSADNAMEMVKVIFPNINEAIFREIITRIAGVAEFAEIVPVPKPKAGTEVGGKPPEVQPKV